MGYGTATPHIASYLLFKKNDKVAFVLRSNTSWMNGYYGMPSGKIEQGETATAAAIREAKEEVGVTIQPENLKHILTGHRHDEIDWVDFWFEATEWEGELINAEPDIHEELVWLDLEKLPENVIPSVRHYLEQIQAGNAYTEFGWNT